MLQDIDIPDEPTLYPNLDDSLPAAYEDCVTLDASDAAARVATALEAMRGEFMRVGDSVRVMSCQRCCLCHTHASCAVRNLCRRWAAGR